MDPFSPRDLADSDDGADLRWQGSAGSEGQTDGYSPPQVFPSPGADLDLDEDEVEDEVEEYRQLLFQDFALLVARVDSSTWVVEGFRNARGMLDVPVFPMSAMLCKAESRHLCSTVPSITSPLHRKMTPATVTAPIEAATTSSPACTAACS